MRIILIPLIVLINSSICYSITYSLSDTCTISFKDVYDFNVGDVFQEYSEEIHWSTKDGEDYHDIRKYTIIDKTISGDTLLYHISGRYYSYVDFATGEIISEEYGDIDEDIVFIDSLPHFLNQPDSSVVLLDPGYGSGMYTYLLEFETNGLRKKSRGGWNNMYTYDQDSLLVPTDGDVIIEDTYAFGLGQIESNMEAGDSYYSYLMGYIKNGDTTGTVWSDTRFYLGIELAGDDHVNNLYPNPAYDKIIISASSDIPIGSAIYIYSLDGILILSKEIMSHEINIGELNKGIFIYKILHGNRNIMSGKFIKE